MVLSSIPSHSIHTIHGTLSGFSSGHNSSSYKVLEAIAPLPRSGNMAPQRISFPSKATPIATHSEPESDSQISWKVVQRPTRVPPRRAPPPPPRKYVPPPPIEIKSDEADPFSDEATNYITLVDATPTPIIDLSSSYSSPIEIHIHPTSEPTSQPLASDSIFYQPPGLSLPYSEEQQRTAEHAARLKFVAGMLMTRVHCHVRPLRRRPVLDPWLNSSMKRAYVRSGLSRAVSVDAE